MLEWSPYEAIMVAFSSMSFFDKPRQILDCSKVANNIGGKRRPRRADRGESSTRKLTFSGRKADHEALVLGGHGGADGLQVLDGHHRAELPELASSHDSGRVLEER